MRWLFSALALSSWLFSGCASEGVRTVPDEFSLEPGELSFGAVYLGGSVSLTAVVRNDGVSRIQLEVDEIPAGFVVEPEKASLPPGGELSFEVSFAPEAEGAAAGAIRFRSQGSGVEAHLGVDAVGVPWPFEVVDSLEFGEVLLGEEETLPLRIRSLTDLPLYVDFALSGKEAFSVDRAWVELPPHGTQTLEVTFAPKARASVVGSIEFSGCDGCPTRKTELRGRGVAYVLSAEPDAVEFGSVPVGLEASRTIVLRNEGDRPISLVAPVWEPGPSPFSITSVDVSNPLGVGGVGSITIRFAPQIKGPANAGLRLRDTSGVELAVVPVAGLRGGPLLKLAPERLDFGLQPLGRSLARTVRIENLGEPGLALLEAASLEGEGAHAFSIGAPDLPVDVGAGTTEILVFLQSEQEGTWEAELVLHTGLAGQPTLRLPSSVDSVDPLPCHLETSREEIRFGLVETDYNGVRSLDVTNVGPDPCMLWGVGTEGESAAAFFLDVPLPDVFFLAPEEVLPLPVRFHAAHAPHRIALYAELLVPAGPVDDPPIRIPVSGARAGWTWHEGAPILPVFEATPVDRATVASAHVLDRCGKSLSDISISSDSSEAFRFPASQSTSTSGKCEEPIRIAFIPDSEGVHRGQLELWTRHYPFPYLIDLEAVAVGPCEGCDWPTPHCMPELTVEAHDELLVEDDWAHECNWSVFDPVYPRGGLVPANLDFGLHGVDPSGNVVSFSCKGVLQPFVVRDYSLSNLRVRPDGRAAFCESTIHAVPKNGLWVEFKSTESRSLRNLFVRALSGEGGDPALKESWFDTQSACPSEPTKREDSCTWGEERAEDDPVIGNYTRTRYSVHVEQPSRTHPYHLGVLADFASAPISVDGRIFCDGALVAEPSLTVTQANSNDFVVLGSVQFSSPSGCVFTPDGLTTFPYFPPPTP